MCWCGMIELPHSWKNIKVNWTGNAWNNLGQLNWTLPKYEFQNEVELSVAMQPFGKKLGITDKNERE